MKHPTPEEVHEYERRLDAVIAARDAGLPYDKLTADLHAYMLAHGFGEEGAGAADFPELSEGDEG